MTHLDPPRTGLERLIADAWESVLGFSPIGRDDTFAELGGTSLQAERVLMLLRRRLARDLGPTILRGRPTLSEIAERVESDARTQFRTRASDAYELAAPESPQRPTLFCVAGAGSSAVAFLSVANRFGDRRRVVAFQQHGFQTRGLPDVTVTAHARRHLRSVQRHEPHGPYTLIGHSFGGHVATAMALMLEDRGERVDRVVLLDTVLSSLHSSSVADFEGAPASTPSPTERLRTHVRILTAGLVLREPDVQQAVFWEHGIRSQNRHRVRRLARRTTVLVSDQNEAQLELWRAIGGADVRRVAGDHNDTLSTPAALDAIADAIGESAGA